VNGLAVVPVLAGRAAVEQLREKDQSVEV